MDNIQNADVEQFEMMKIAIGNISSGICLYRANAVRQTEIAEQVKRQVQKQCCILDMEELSPGEYPMEMGKLKALLKGQEDAQVVFLCNLQLCWKKLGEEFFQNLNYMRDQMFAMNKVWVLGISYYMAFLLNKYARDFYSCIMNHFEFYDESEECLTRFAEISYSAGNLTAADKKLKEYKRESDYKGLSPVHSRRISDVAKLWNRLYRYCDADTKEWVRALMSVGEKQYQRKVFSFQDYGFGIEMVRAWMHLEEYAKALDFLNYIIEETESRLISPGPELVETDSLKGEILFFMHRYQEAERNVQKALSLLSEMKKEYGFEFIYANDILAKIWSAQKEYGKAVGLYEKIIRDTIQFFGEKCTFLVGLWENLGAVYVRMRQNERAEDCFLKAAKIWSKDEWGQIRRAEIMEKLGILLEQEGDFSAAIGYYVQVEDVCMEIDIARKDEKHLKNLRDRIMAYYSMFVELEKKKEQV